MLYLNKASSLFDIGRGFGSYEEAVKSIRAKVLMIGESDDILFPVSQIKQHAENFKALGKQVTYFEYRSGFGHLGGVAGITQAGEVITKFMTE
jgi:homoserine O-acetyltransferase